MFLQLLTIYSIIMIVVCITNYKLGLSLYLVYSILVPVPFIYIGGFTIGTNLFNLLLLIILMVRILIRNNKFRFDYKFLLPFVFLYTAQFLLIPFHLTETPLTYQLNAFRVDLMGILIPPFLLMNTLKFDRKAIVYLKVAFIAAVAIATLYGLYLLTRIGENPYLEIIKPLNQGEVLDQDSVLEEGLRVFGYISSVFTDTSMYGIFLSTSIFFMLFMLKVDKKKLWLILTVMLIINAATCGMRSCMIACVVSLVFYTIINKLYNNLLYIAAILLAGYAVLMFIPNFSLLLETMFTGNVNGSSIDMRMDQLKGCFDEIQGKEFFGNGYGWTGYYRNEIGRHPVMLSFESILIVILCNNGFMGLVIWGIFITLYIRRCHRIPIDRFTKNILYTLLVAYFSYAFSTGDYGYMKYLTLYYTIVIAYSIYSAPARRKQSGRSLSTHTYEKLYY